MVITVNGSGVEETAGGVRVSSGADLQTQYDQLTALVLRMGAWLTGPKAQLLPRAAWEEQYARYGEQLEKLRELGDRLRPVSLRDRFEPMAGDALVSEVLELFAA
jgi:hypothetical protein